MKTVIKPGAAAGFTRTTAYSGPLRIRKNRVAMLNKFAGILEDDGTPAACHAAKELRKAARGHDIDAQAKALGQAQPVLAALSRTYSDPIESLTFCDRMNRALRILECIAGE
jgi:hypothetical protein